MSRITINPERPFCGKPLGPYDPKNDAFEKYKERTDNLPPIGKGKIDWSKLDLSKVETMVANNPGVPIWTALAKAKEQGKIIVPNSVHDRMLVETNHWQKDDIKAGYAAWIGTAIIYEKPDTAFGDKVVCNWEHDRVNYSITFNIPEQFRGKANCALIAEHPDFELVSLGNNSYELKADEKSISLLENFPKETFNMGGYHYDERFRIPVGEPLNVQQADNTVRYLWRIAGSYIGLLARDYRGFDRQRVVGAGGCPSYPLGVHVISREAAPPKNEG